MAVFENVVLVEATDAKEACNKARQYGEDEARPDLNEGRTINDLAAEDVFLGIRKVVAISNPPTIDLDQDRPIDGTEITYMRFNIGSESELHDLISGGEVDLTYVE